MTKKNFETLEVGGVYRDRYRNIVEIININPVTGNFVAKSGLEYGSNGCDCNSVEHNLIEQVWITNKPPEPEPVALYKGCFVELNDGSIVGPVKPCDSKAYPWIILGCFMHTSDGRIVKIGDDSSPRDIKRVLSPETTLAELGCKPRSEGE
jgi:hypothetical protein